MKIRCIDLHLYGEVHQVTAYRDGLIYDTKSTGKYIATKDRDKLPKDFFMSSVSSRLNDYTGKPLDENGFYYVNLEMYEHTT